MHNPNYKLIVILFLIITQSCNQKDLRVESKNKNSDIKSDSIFYDLPPKTITFIEDTLLKGLEVNYCTLIINSSYNEFSFSFEHYTKNKIPFEVKKYIDKTNRFLRLNNKMIPLLFITDFIFNKELHNGQKITREFDNSYVLTNAQGEIKDAFSYKWDFSEKSK